MDDLEFVQRCSRGDKQAWGEFITRYSRLIYSYIRNVAKLKGIFLPEDQIKDLFQDIFANLIKDNCRKLRSYKARNGCTLATWLRQVTVNATLDYLRKRKPIVSLDEEIDGELSLHQIIPAETAHTLEHLAQEETYASLQECIKRLDTDEKYFLELHYRRNFDFDELKDYFSISRAAIDMRKSRIIEKLRDCFKSKGFALGPAL